MRVAGRIAADALVEVGRHVAPGVTTDELDRIGHEFMIAARRLPVDPGLQGLPEVAVHTVNEVICHGIPDARPLEDGDVVKVDITAFIDGVHGDTCATFFAGDVSPEVRDLGERTREAMLRGIRAVRPGRPVSVIGRVIESYARALRLRRRARLHRPRRRAVASTPSRRSCTTTSRARPRSWNRA